jgi:NitT/TauT family transport system ATP-binding protein
MNSRLANIWGKAMQTPQPSSNLLTRDEPRRHAVDVRDLHKSYLKDGRTIDIIRNLDLLVREGELVSIIGLSGCGKSTLLKVLAGLTPYQGGEVRIAGEAVTGPRADVGFVFQHLALLPWRTVLANVLLPAQLTGMNRTASQRSAEACLAMVGLTGFERHYIREISGGMQQRVALARVLMTDAKLLLLDEPFSALDELTREGVNALFLDVCAKAGATTVLVTHSIIEAVWMSDRVVVMPSTVGGEVQSIDVPLPRPRTPEVHRAPEFADSVDAVRAALGMDR